MATLGRVEVEQRPTTREPGNNPKARLAIFISADSFEHFYGGMFGLTREQYLRSYRNDFVWDYGWGLRDEGHEVFIYILSYGPAELREVEENISVRFIPLPAWLRAVDPLLYRLRGIPGLALARERIRFMAYGSQLREALRSDGIEVLYHQEIWTPRFSVVVPRVSVPVVGADHGARFSRRTSSRQRRAFQLAAHVSCQSVEGLDHARSMGAKAVLMYNGVDTDKFAPPPEDRPRSMRILTVGRMVESQKRFSDLIQAMSLLPEFRLMIVGSGPDAEKLRLLSIELGIGDRVEFAGFISDREQLRRLYQECGVFVSSSAWEATALVVLEAMSCGAPVVATKIPSFEDLFVDGQDGLLVPVGQPERIASAVRQAYHSRRELGHQARETVVRRYSARALYRNLSDLIQGVNATV